MKPRLGPYVGVREAAQSSPGPGFTRLDPGEALQQPGTEGTIWR